MKKSIVPLNKKDSNFCSCGCCPVGQPMREPQSRDSLEIWFRRWQSRRDICDVKDHLNHHPDNRTDLSREDALRNFWRALHYWLVDARPFKKFKGVPKVDGPTSEEILREQRANRQMRTLFMATALSKPVGTVVQKEPAPTRKKGES